MRWRFPLFRQGRKESETADAIRELREALYNRAALKPETLRLYRGMLLARAMRD